MYFVDTETCGLVGFPITIQFALDDGEIFIHEIFNERIIDTLELIEEFCDEGVVMFNSAFDWFHLQKCYNCLALIGSKDPMALYSPPEVGQVLDVEHEAPDGECIKPCHTVDLMLYARKGPYQSLMERDDVIIRRVPRPLAPLLIEELDERVRFDNIYFTRRHGRTWEIEELKVPDETLVNVKLVFAASSGLKALAAHVFKVDVLDYPAPRWLHPKEKLWYPYHDPDEVQSWGYLASSAIDFWHHDQIARRYAREDVEWTRRLYQEWQPPLDDDDSILACSVGSSRWKGFKTDVERVKLNYRKSMQTAHAVPERNQPEVVLRELHSRMSELEALTVTDTSTKPTLEMVSKWTEDTDGTSVSHPAALYAQKVIAARTHSKRLNMYEKLLKLNGRVHFAFKPIGALSGRMSGDGKFNPQGVDQDNEVRLCFPLAFEDEELAGGDFDAFEVSIMAAAYNDENLTQDLQSGKKLHAVVGTFLYDEEYDDVVATKDMDSLHSKYKRAKNWVFASAYGAHDERLAETADIGVKQAQLGRERLEEQYPGIKREREAVYDAFCSMRQPGGLGTRVEWHEPADYVESLLGFRRYYTLENKICRALFDLAQTPPKAWHDRFRDLKVVRREERGKQTLVGATMSAIFACAFQIQARNLRSAVNHRIQSTGAGICKRLQRKLYDIQPAGVHPWVVRPMNVHDEVDCPHHPGARYRVQKAVNLVVQWAQEVVPLTGITWKFGMTSWGEKE